ncbi:probable RNA-directed DNA polymerase from transposon BS [Trichonephila clavipes]|nr:probable RNA-directed DNA polymerase from transposon BS [Trichonephila clavipes]
MILIYLQLVNDAKADSIFQFTEMFGTQISFERYDNSRNKRPNQCWRCQGFFHSSELCHLPLKCAGPHEAKNCSRAFEDPLICANCGGEHAANWHQCLRFLKTKNNKKAPQKGNQNENQHPKGNNPNNFNEIASDIRHLFRARWKKTIEELSPETHRHSLEAYLPSQKAFSSHSPLKGALGSIAVAPIEKAEVIVDSLQKQFEPNTDVENPRFSAHIQMKVQKFIDSSTCMDLERTSPSEIQGLIKNLKPNKSPGIDLITNRNLKNLPIKFIIFIALLFNMLLENCYFLKSWRMAMVIPILKLNSDDSNPQNYSSISLLSSLSKAFEFVILNRLNQHCLAGNIIIPEQHGFVTKCSTVTQLLRVTELVHTGFQNHQATGMLFLDINKAFDKIWHDGLISKMMRLGFSDQILKIIHSQFTSNLNSRV